MTKCDVLGSIRMESTDSLVKIRNNQMEIAVGGRKRYKEVNLMFLKLTLKKKDDPGHLVIVFNAAFHYLLILA